MWFCRLFWCIFENMICKINQFWLRKVEKWMRLFWDTLFCASSVSALKEYILSLWPGSVATFELIFAQFWQLLSLLFTFLTCSSQLQQRQLNQEREAEMRQITVVLAVPWREFFLWHPSRLQSRAFSPLPPPSQLGGSFLCCHSSDCFLHSWKSAVSLAGTQAPFFSLPVSHAAIVYNSEAQEQVYSLYRGVTGSYQTLVPKCDE